MQADFSSEQELLPSLANGDQPDVPGVYSSGVIDSEDGWGHRRLLAVISTNSSGNHRDLNADTLLGDLSTTFFGAPLMPAEAALERAIEAVYTRFRREASGASDAPVLGLAVGALEGERLFIAAAAPCQAMLRQDGEVLHLPETDEAANDEPVAPKILETTLNADDRFALLATNDPFEPTAFYSAEALEQAAGPNGSFIWLEVAEEPPPAPAPRPSSVAEPLPPVPAAQIEAAAAAGVVHVAWDRPRSEGPRLLQRPPGSDALNRYRSRRRGGLPSPIRSRLPRGIPSTRSMLLAAMVIALIVVASYFAIQRRPERTYPESATAGQYSEAVAAAIAAEDTDLVNALMPGAHTLLDRAGGDEANDPESVALRAQIVAAEDYLNNIVRLTNPRRIGSLPESLHDEQAYLVQGAGIQYLLAGDLYMIDVDGNRLVALPELVAEQAAGALINGGGDVSTLAMTTTETAYFYGDSVGGSTTVLPGWPSEFGLRHTDGSVFRGRLYLMDRESAEIVVIDPEADSTALWIQRDSEVLPEGALGMAIDGGIHVLYASGDIYTLREGYVVEKSTLPIQPALTEPLAISHGSLSNLVYLADLGVPEGRLIAWDTEGRTATVYQVGPDTGGHLDGEVHEAFSRMTDLLISESTSTIYWIADGALWQADLPVTFEEPAGEEEESTGEEAEAAATPEA